MPASAIAAAQMRFGREILPLAERFQKEARVYNARSAQLDPLISALAKLVAAHPESFVLVAPIREGIDEAMSAIQGGDSKSGKGYISLSAGLNKMKHLGRIFQKCYAISIDAEQLVAEGNAMVQRWDVELRQPL